MFGMPRDWIAHFRIKPSCYTAAIAIQGISTWPLTDSLNVDIHQMELKGQFSVSCSNRENEDRMNKMKDSKNDRI